MKSIHCTALVAAAALTLPLMAPGVAFADTRRPLAATASSVAASPGAHDIESLVAAGADRGALTKGPLAPGETRHLGTFNGVDVNISADADRQVSVTRSDSHPPTTVHRSASKSPCYAVVEAGLMALGAAGLAAALLAAGPEAATISLFGMSFARGVVQAAITALEGGAGAATVASFFCD